MTEELHMGYLERSEDIQVQIHQVGKFDDSSSVHTTCLGKTDRSRKGCHEGPGAIINYRSVHDSKCFT